MFMNWGEILYELHLLEGGNNVRIVPDEPEGRNHVQIVKEFSPGFMTAGLDHSEIF